MSQKIIIIGAGQAACSCAARLRENDDSCEILLIGNENILPYQRPPLSKKYATGDMVQEQLLLRPADWYETNNIRHIKNVSASAVDVETKQVTLSDKSALPYDKLVFATGSRARQLPVVIGGNLSSVYVLRSIDDADKISKQLLAGKKALIIGGGYIGLEAAAVCIKKGLSVTLVEASERILQRVACPETSNWFRKLHQDNGVTIYESVGLEKILESPSGGITAQISDGTSIDADFVLVGIGIQPNSELAEVTGIAVDGGIVVDRNCQTSNPDIYAAGDCAVFPYRDQQTRLESVQNAIDQAECAADNINGEARSYSPHPWFWSDQYEVKLQIAGLNSGYNKIVIREGEREGAISHFYFADETLLAVDAMNDPRTYMVVKKMLEAGKNISPEQAGDKTLELKSLM